MATFLKTITIDFRNPRQKSLRDWLSGNEIDATKLPPLSLEVGTDVELDDFDPDEVIEYYETMMDYDSDGTAVARAYRYLAEGDIASAMEELAQNFDLAPPSHARAIADLLSGNRNPPHVQG